MFILNGINHEFSDCVLPPCQLLNSYILQKLFFLEKRAGNLNRSQRADTC